MESDWVATLAGMVKTLWGDAFESEIWNNLVGT